MYEISAIETEQLCIRAKLAVDERLVGFGEQFVAVDQRGRTVSGWIEDILFSHPRSAYYIAPLYHSSAGYSLLFDTYLPFVADVGETDHGQLSIRLGDRNLRCFVLHGHPSAIMTRVGELTGPTLQPPDWTFGVWTCCVSGTDRVLAEVDRIRAEQIPCSAVWVYDHYDPETNSGCGSAGTYDKGEYPDYKELVDALHLRGFMALTYLNPAVYSGTPHFRELEARGMLVRRPNGGAARFPFFHPEHQAVGTLTFEKDVGALVDFTHPDAIQYWRDNLHAIAWDQGWDGWMEDFGEQVEWDMVFHDGSTGDATHNRYSSLYHSATAAALRELKPDAVTFVRAGFLGDQKHVTMLWAGDQSCDWTRQRGIRSVIPAGISAGMSGVSIWGPDISGIVELTDDAELGRSKELWIRWLQLGALSPVMRVHLGFKEKAGTPVDMWTDQHTLDAFRQMSRLHMRLFPYLKRLAREATEGGAPILRGLFFEFPDDPECWSIDDQYLLGPALLVAPVLDAGARRRSLYLPAGEWSDFWTGEAFTGDGWTNVEAPLHKIPLFQRVGHVLELLAEEDLPMTVATQTSVAGRNA
ncbi:MAG: TIM-barrel domain-containing protein [Candidatus Dormibacteria bacterium]